LTRAILTSCDKTSCLDRPILPCFQKITRTKEQSSGQGVNEAIYIVAYGHSSAEDEIAPSRTHRKSLLSCLCRMRCSHCDRMSRRPGGSRRRSTVSTDTRRDKGRFLQRLRPRYRQKMFGLHQLFSCIWGFLHRREGSTERTSKLYWVPKYSKLGNSSAQMS